MTRPQLLTTLCAALILALALTALWDLAPHWGYGMPQAVRLGTLGAGLTGLLAFAVLWERVSWVLKQRR